MEVPTFLSILNASEVWDHSEMAPLPLKGHFFSLHLLSLSSAACHLFRGKIISPRAPTILPSLTLPNLKFKAESPLESSPRQIFAASYGREFRNRLREKLGKELRKLWDAPLIRSAESLLQGSLVMAANYSPPPPSSVPRCFYPPKVQ